MTPNPASRGQPRWFGTCQHLSARVSTCQHMCVLARPYLPRIAPSRCTLCLVAHAVPPPSSQCAHSLPCQLRMSTRRNTDISATGTAHIRRLTIGLQRPERVRDLAYSHDRPPATRARFVTSHTVSSRRHQHQLALRGSSVRCNISNGISPAYQRKLASAAAAAATTQQLVSPTPPLWEPSSEPRLSAPAAVLLSPDNPSP